MEIQVLDDLIRVAGHALARHGLVHAYGHCSVRLSNVAFRASPAKPLGLATPADCGTTVSLDAPLPDGVLGEVRVHREIYRRRADVNAVVRCTPPRVMTLSTALRTPRARHGFGSYFYPALPLWPDAQLLRNDDAAERLAEMMGSACGIVMRGNGVVIAAESLQQAVVLAWFLEDAARVELECLAAGIADAGLLTRDEAMARATWSGRIVERMWDYLTRSRGGV